jgi:polyferredoxin
VRQVKKPLPDTLKPKEKKRFWGPRHIVQLTFAALNVWLCVQFYNFVVAAQTTVEGPLPPRPAGVEGWLPISGLMGIVDWFASGALNPVHPASAILVLCFLVMSFLLRKAFCSWLCPVGTISDGLATLGRKIFGRNFLPPRWLDYPLMSLKYLLLGFFLFSFFVMGVAGINSFLDSPYNQVADVKMLLFFVNIGGLGAITLIGLAVGSVFIKGFWCRYWCPYGALLGLVSWASPFKIMRNTQTCIDCDKCDKACPSRLPVATKLQIVSVECTGCMECEAACPIRDCIHLTTGKRWTLDTKKLAWAVTGIFLAFVLTAKITGHWQTNVTDEAYRYHLQRLENPEYGHPGR